MAVSKPNAPGQGFASAMDPWQPKPFTSPFAQAAGAKMPTVGPGGAPVAQPRLGPQAPPLGAPSGALGASGGAGGGLGMQPPGMRPQPFLGGKGIQPGMRPPAVPGAVLNTGAGGAMGSVAPGIQMDGPQQGPKPVAGRAGVTALLAQMRARGQRATSHIETPEQSRIANNAIGMPPPSMSPGIQMDGPTPQAFSRPSVMPSGAPAPPPPPDGGGISPAPISSAAQHAHEQRARNQANQAAARQKKADYNAAKDAAKAQGTTLAAQHVAERKAAAAAKKAGKGVSLGTGATAY